jgi:hypothetical protein
MDAPAHPARHWPDEQVGHARQVDWLFALHVVAYCPLAHETGLHGVGAAIPFTQRYPTGQGAHASYPLLLVSSV